MIARSSALAVLSLFLVACIQGAANHEAIAAYSSLFAAIVAAFSAIYSILQVRNQIRIQSDFERRRLEERYLSQAMYAIHDCWRAAQTFVAAWNHRRSATRDPNRELSDDEKAMRREFMEAFWKFDSDLASSVNVRKAAEGSSELVRAIESAHLHAISLFDLVMENPDAFESESALMETEQAKSAKKSAEIAADLLARRLSDVYKKA
jgi:hypothetical protein